MAAETGCPDGWVLGQSRFMDDNGIPMWSCYKVMTHTAPMTLSQWEGQRQCKVAVAESRSELEWFGRLVESEQDQLENSNTGVLANIRLAQLDDRGGWGGSICAACRSLAFSRRSSDVDGSIGYLARSSL